MKVRITRTQGTADPNYPPHDGEPFVEGQTADVGKELADQLIARGLAEPLDKAEAGAHGHEKAEPAGHGHEKAGKK